MTEEEVELCVLSALESCCMEECGGCALSLREGCASCPAYIVAICRDPQAFELRGGRAVPKAARDEG